MLLDPTTVTAIIAAVGTVVSGLGGRWLGGRAALRKIESGATRRIVDGYGDALEDLRAQVRESRADRQHMHDEMSAVRLRLRDVEATSRAIAVKFETLLEHVRVLRMILREHKIEHPPGPDFLDDGGAG